MRRRAAAPKLRASPTKEESMTPDESAALVRRGYEAFNAGDLATLTEPFREDAFAHQPGTSSLSGDYRGRDNVFRFFGLLAERSGGTFRAELERLFASDRRVVAIHHATASRRRQGRGHRRRPGGPAGLG